LVLDDGQVLVDSNLIYETDYPALAVHFARAEQLKKFQACPLTG
jgi:hypothetical protein